MSTTLRRAKITEIEAYCDCGWGHQGAGRAGHLDCTRAAREHAERTGHTVQVYREQTAHIGPTES